MATVSKRRKKVAAKPSSKPSKAASKNGHAQAKSAKSSGRKVGKMIYHFSKSRTDGDGTMKPLLGGKGANLAAMTRIGLPVPPGFTITTEVCMYYYENGKKFPPTLARTIVKAAVAWLEKETGKKFGDHEEPAAGFGSLRRSRFDARHDGYDS